MRLARFAGAFNPIETNVKGIRISEHLPNLAKVADKYTLIRSVTSPEAAHERGAHYMMTGFEPLPGFAVPSYGSVASQQLTPARRNPAIYRRAVAGNVWRRGVFRRGT